MITDKSKFPLYDVMYMPVLNEYSSGKSITLSDLTKKVYEKYYSEYSLDIMAGKSGTPAIYDRIHRANYALFAGNFLERVGRGEYKITKKGIDYLKSGRTLTYNYLITEDNDYKNSSYHLGKKAFNDISGATKKNTNDMSPQDMLELGYQQLEAPKKEELLEKLMNIDPFIFEKVVGTLCEAMGYGTFLETPKSHDGGIDGVIKGDSLGFERIYIQAKRYGEGNCVQGKEMQNFVGALALTSVRRGIFFTTSTFVDNAKKTAENASKSGQEIILIDGKMLVDLMFKYNVGIQTKETYEIKYIDEDFFLGFN